ncbi:hypothetical protein QQF64_018180 [Cirrhinus molitorella]|uniref:Uncharacterized protein n=1 Tax=Cirrhinus molitorella TaxID=172907 RepID=A0ABR3LKS3_9TELE
MNIVLNAQFLSITIMTERPFTGPNRPRNGAFGGTIASVVLNLFASRSPQKAVVVSCVSSKVTSAEFVSHRAVGWILALLTLLCPVAHFLCD